jgi:prepilin-type N-terminal cleavage/methylation domain-containing protein
MNARHFHARGGFTLIEMIITLCIFVMLAAAVFGIFGATLESVGSLQDDQSREDQAEALGAWLKQSFLALPADGVVLSLHREGAPFQVADLIWGDGNQVQALDLHLQPNGNYTLRLAAYSPATATASGASAAAKTFAAQAGSSGSFAARTFAAEVSNDDPSLEWRPLIRDIKTADWRFRPANITEWQDIAPGDRQVQLIELNFQIAGSRTGVTDDFWIPPLQPANNPALAPAVSVTANP